MYKSKVMVTSKPQLNTHSLTFEDIYDPNSSRFLFGITKSHGFFQTVNEVFTLNHSLFVYLLKLLTRIT